jgi:proteasome accessory factor C
MSESALDRTARALDLVPYLLEHQGISISELATVFGVSERQINEDLVLIHMCGLPGYTPLELIEMYYEDGFVTVSDPQSFNRPRKMSRSEMTSLLVSLDLLKSLRADQIAEEIVELQRKLARNLEFENPIVVVQKASNHPLLKTLEDAISKSYAIQIVYLSGVKDERSERIIIPLEIYHSNGFTYLGAWCQTSNADRTFRLDRIVSCVAVTGGAAISDAVAVEYQREGSPIILKVARAARNFIDENRSIIAKIDGEHELLVTLNALDKEWLIKTVLGYGGLIQVLEPTDLAVEIQSRARTILEVYIGK